jgi:hypothetical protein
MKSVTDLYSYREIAAGTVLVALWSYTPHQLDEMLVRRGNTVIVEDVYDDGWASGHKYHKQIWDIDAGDSDQLLEIVPVDDVGTASDGIEDEITVVSGAKFFPLACLCHWQAWKEVSTRHFFLQTCQGHGPRLHRGR